MAPLPEISNVYRTALSWINSDTGATAANVMHFRKSGVTPADLATDLDANVDADMWEAQGTHSHIRQVDITPLDGSSVTFPFVTGSPAKWSGALSGNAPTLQVASLVKLVTGRRGRSYRGRVFLPFVDETAIDNARLTAGVVTAGQAQWEAFHTAMDADGWQIVVASYKLSTAEEVIAVLFETDTATQRRRNKRQSA